ncbi:hypothetical protein [Kitasatospora sp. NPDC005748]|uniref:hypothetical protein n=1 Tax=Kitasatospora sp. NPDC005748 TaxID=3157063 RepID=UPI0033D6205C
MAVQVDPTVGVQAQRGGRPAGWLGRVAAGAGEGGGANRQVALSFTDRGDWTDQAARVTVMPAFLEASFCGGR